MSAGPDADHASRLALLKRHLGAASEAERTIETQLRDFARQAVDDSEVEALFATHADATVRQQQRLSARLGELGDGLSDTPVLGASTVNVSPQIATGTSVAEEQQLQNIIIAYTAEAGELAMYEQLARTAQLSGDAVTEALAREIQAEEQAMAEKLWHLLPSRSKIAFNMLTISELDPAVETRLADDRIES